jgi:predicted aconitase with swiveling domain
VTAQGEVLLPGAGVTAPGFALTAPISFWGGVDPKTGTISDPRHPEHGVRLGGLALMIPSTVGSSSAAAILLELVHGGRAPAAVILHEPDAILLLGLIVAKEMGLQTPIAIRLDRDRFASLHQRQLEISAAGAITSLSADLE